MRILLAIAGTVFVALGVIGAVLPVLPTTPFLLLAAGCYARSSERLHGRLLASPWFGPSIRNWQEHRAISPRARTLAIVMIVISFGISMTFAVSNLWGQAAMALLGASVITWIYRLQPAPDKERQS